MKKLISILGSTGSIGLSALEIVDKKRDYFKISLLSANKNYTKISKQIKKYNPEYFIINDKLTFEKIKKKFKKKKIKILNNFESLNSIKKNDIFISAIPGIAGLLPTLKIIKFSKKLLLANKESIICGWSLIKKEALKYNTKLVPIDSEHFSISKLIENQNIKDIRKVYITASGGPFLNYKKNKLKKITPRDALNHPKWKMGKKISIDSSTLMNKILELIEASKLFNISNSKLDILVHPNSLVHAIIVFKNGLTKFIYHETSMIIPLSNAIFGDKLNIEKFYKIKNNSIIENLTFKKVDKQIFPIYKLKNRLDEYPSTSIIINAANEVLVSHFLKKKIPFLSIYKIIMAILNDSNYRKYAIRKPINFNIIYQIDEWTRNLVKKKLDKLK